MALKTLASATITTQNVAQQLSATSTPAHSLILSASGGTIWVGDSNVNSTPGSERGFAIASGATYTLYDEISNNGFNFTQVYISSSTTSAKLIIAYTQA